MNPCVYCGAPWPDPVLDIEHKIDCPSITNLFPVRVQDIEPHGFCCFRCGDEFEVGDVYTDVPHEDAEGHTHSNKFEVVCLSCATIGIGAR